jgi:uncharacterized protein (TIGR02145 family)
MTNKSNAWIYTIAVISIMLMLSNSCKKDENAVPPPSTVTDLDGNVYHTLIIGSQVWLQENLKTTRYRNGNPIPGVTDSIEWNSVTAGAYCTYDNNPDNKAVYGFLYNWKAVSSKDTLAPKGWHVPTQTEWTILSNYLGGQGVGGRLKETGAAHWQSPNVGASNQVLFTALPGGMRSVHGVFSGLGTLGTWWTSTGDGSFDAWGRYINYNDSTLFRYDDSWKAGFSVRCIMD